MGIVRAVSRSGMLSVAVALVAGSPAAAQDQGQATKGDRLETFDEHGLTVRSPGGRVNFHLGGRLHFDAGTGGTSAPVEDFPTNFAIRRLWFEPKLTIDNKLIFNFQWDVSSESTPVANLLLSYKGFAPFTVTGGNFREPFMLDELTSNNDTMFMERSLVDAFAHESAGRNTGVAVGTHGQNWTLSGGVFGGNINESVGGQGIAGTARVTYAPILTPDQVLHFGMSGSYRSLDDDDTGASFSSRPESFLFDARLVDTGDIDGARAISRLGLEFAWANGPYRMQAEYVATDVDRDRRPETFFQGGYLQGSWVINGKSAPYVVDSDTATEIGIFKRVQPERGERVSQGGIGVFEAAARYSVIDLTSHDIHGGFEQDVTVGLNWYR